MGRITLLLRILGELNPGVLILIAHQLYVLRNQCTARNRYSLVPCLVVNLSKCVCVTDELTSGPFSELTVVPGQISICVVLLCVLERSQVEDCPRRDQITTEFSSLLLVNTEVW